MNKYVWTNQPRYNKHVWAFIYFCRRLGDTVNISYNGDDTMDVEVLK